MFLQVSSKLREYYPEVCCSPLPNLGQPNSQQQPNTFMRRLAKLMNENPVQNLETVPAVSHDVSLMPKRIDCSKFPTNKQKTSPSRVPVPPHIRSTVPPARSQPKSELLAREVIPERARKVMRPSPVIEIIEESMYSDAEAVDDEETSVDERDSNSSPISSSTMVVSVSEDSEGGESFEESASSAAETPRHIRKERRTAALSRGPGASQETKIRGKEKPNEVIPEHFQKTVEILEGIKKA